MRIYLTTSILLLFCAIFCQAQKPGKLNTNALSFELGKTGLICNVSYDHKFGVKNFGIRAIAGYNFSNYVNAKSFGGGVYYLLGKANRFFEVGADLHYLIIFEETDDQKSVPLVYPDYSTKTFYPSLNFGYRLYGEITVFRVGISPGLIDSKFVPGGYIGFGLTF
jgi:hypothetical protein